MQTTRAVVTLLLVLTATVVQAANDPSRFFADATSNPTEIACAADQNTPLAKYKAKLVGIPPAINFVLSDSVSPVSSPDKYTITYQCVRTNSALASAKTYGLRLMYPNGFSHQGEPKPNPIGTGAVNIPANGMCPVSDNPAQIGMVSVVDCTLLKRSSGDASKAPVAALAQLQRTLKEKCSTDELRSAHLDECRKASEEYLNHPSFVQVCLGVGNPPKEQIQRAILKACGVEGGQQPHASACPDGQVDARQKSDAPPSCVQCASGTVKTTVQDTSGHMVEACRCPSGMSHIKDETDITKSCTRQNGSDCICRPTPQRGPAGACPTGARREFGDHGGACVCSQQGFVVNPAGTACVQKDPRDFTPPDQACPAGFARQSAGGPCIQQQPQREQPRPQRSSGGGSPQQQKPGGQQGGRGGQQQPQQQQQPQMDPTLWQRLMQMLQKPFQPGNPTATTDPTTATCSEFSVDGLDTDSYGYYLAEVRKPITINWSVDGGTRIRINTSPKLKPEYESGATSATIVPDRTGTLIVRLSIDDHFYTKDPCVPIKIRVKDKH